MISQMFIIWIFLDSIAVIIGVNAFTLETAAGFNSPGYFVPIDTKQMHQWIKYESKDGKCPKTKITPHPQTVSTKHSDSGGKWLEKSLQKPFAIHLCFLFTLLSASWKLFKITSKIVILFQFKWIKSILCYFQRQSKDTVAWKSNLTHSGLIKKWNLV